MKVVQKARLRFCQGSSDKVYEVDLCDVFTVKGRLYVVNFRYGRFGSTLREGSKTPEPVDKQSAQKIFDSLVIAKLNKGYYDTQSNHTPQERDKHLPAHQNSPSARNNRILQYLDNPPQHWKLSRIIWRAGELRLKNCADKILKHLENKRHIQNYSVVWALGRVGDHSHLKTINQYLFDHNYNIQNIAFEASLHLMLPRKRDEVLDTRAQALPENVKLAIRQQDLEALAACFSGQMRKHTKALEALQIVYSLALKDSVCQQATLQTIAALDARFPSFVHAFRHLYKIAEFRDDYEVLAALIYRLTVVNNEKTDLSLSYVGKIHWQRRAWRTLRHLGESDNSQFVDFAENVLLRFSDQDLQFREVDYSDYNYKPFAGNLAFNQLLYRTSKAYVLNASGSAFIETGAKDGTQRTEAFPELWNKAPQKLLNLLLQSQNNEVQQFAAKALKDNETFCVELCADILIALLNSTYSTTSDFALALLIARFDSQNPDLEVLKACVGSANTAAHQQLIAWLNESPQLLQSSSHFTALVLMADNRDIGNWGNRLIASLNFTATEKQQVIEAICRHLSTMNEDFKLSDIDARIAQLNEYFSQTIHSLDLNHLTTVVEHMSADIQYFGAKLLILNRARAEDIPERWFSRFSQSDNTALQSMGVALLAKFDDRYLQLKQDLLLSYCQSGVREIRQQAATIVERLVKYSSAFAQTLFDQFIHLLFQSEPVDGVHDDMIELLGTALSNRLKSMDKNLCWRLLWAQSKGAQKLGANTLAYKKHRDFSVKQWAILGKHSDIRARRFAMKAFSDNIGQIQANLSNALEIIHTPWPDTQTFVFSYFQQHLSAEHWTPQLLIGICDNTSEAVQSFGQSLIAEFFEQGDGPEYLLKLSQHPSHNVQLFASDFLSEFASDNLERLKLLRPYFTTVLSKVYRGRLCKDRVMAFLAEQGHNNLEAAQLIMEILQQQSLTLSITDKAACIGVMHQLCLRYPELETPLVSKPLLVKGAKLKGQKEQSCAG